MICHFRIGSRFTYRIVKTTKYRAYSLFYLDVQGKTMNKLYDSSAAVTQTYVDKESDYATLTTCLTSKDKHLCIQLSCIHTSIEP